MMKERFQNWISLLVDHSKSLIHLTKPRLSSLVILTTACGMVIAPSFSDVSIYQSLTILLGTTLIVGAANAFNCYLERDVDAYMERTQKRPLVTGKLQPKTALVFVAVLVVLSMYLLRISSNQLTAWLGFSGFIIYTGIYTPLKKYSVTALFAGAIPGALPPLMGWTAITGSVGVGGLILFLILFCWQLPHFVAISMFREKEYSRAGLKTIPGVFGSEAAQQHLLIYTLFLLLITFLPFPLGLAGWYYLATAILLGLAFLSLCLASFMGVKNINWGRVIFFGSLAYLPMVLGAWVLDQR